MFNLADDNPRLQQDASLLLYLMQDSLSHSAEEYVGGHKARA